MELELLKDIWKETEKPEDTTVSEAIVTVHKAVPAQLKIIAILKKNLFAEVIIVLICVLAIAIFYFTAFNGSFKEVSWMYIALAIIFLMYYYRKNKLLKAMQANSQNVKANLECRLSALEKYIRLYLIAGTVLVPVLLCFFYILVFYKHVPVFPALQESVGITGFTILYIIFSIFFTIVLYYLYRWYIYNLYGKYIDQLKALLYEMGDEKIK